MTGRAGGSLALGLIACTTMVCILIADLELANEAHRAEWSRSGSYIIMFCMALIGFDLMLGED